VRVLASQLLSFLTKLSVMFSKFVLAVCVIGAEFISCFVFATVFFGMADGPFDCVGQAGEKWSLTVAQHGHINQWLADASDLGRWFGLDLGAGSLDAWFLYPVRLCRFNLARASRSKAASHWNPSVSVRVRTRCVHDRYATHSHSFACSFAHRNASY
jgi:hypothetical protein